jgi:hypothetical protein
MAKESALSAESRACHYPALALSPHLQPAMSTPARAAAARRQERFTPCGSF